MQPEIILATIEAMQTELEAIDELRQLFIPEQQRRRLNNTLFVKLWYKIDCHDFISYVNANKFLFPFRYAANLSQCLNMQAQFDEDAKILALKAIAAARLVQNENMTESSNHESEAQSGLFFLKPASRRKASFEQITQDYPDTILLLNNESFARLIEGHPLNLIPSEEQAAKIMQASQEYLDALSAGQHVVHQFNSLCMQWATANNNTTMNLHALIQSASNISLLEFFANNPLSDSKVFIEVYSAYKKRLEEFALEAIGFFKYQSSNCYDKDLVGDLQDYGATSVLPIARPH